MYREILSGMEGSQLLVVNIVTCPIGTDCGWSAPWLKALYLKQAQDFRMKKPRVVLYNVEVHVHASANINCIHSVAR